MPTVALFTNGRSQAVRIPREFEFKGIKEVEITREGNRLILKPARPAWTSLKFNREKNKDFMNARPPVIDETRVLELIR